jgi:hypothetical protein
MFSKAQALDPDDVAIGLYISRAVACINKTEKRTEIA